MKYYLILKKNQQLKEILLGIKDNYVFLPKESPINEADIAYTETLIDLEWPNNVEFQVLESSLGIPLSSTFRWFPLEEVPQFIEQEGALFCRVLSLFWPYLHLHVTSKYHLPKLLYKVTPQEEVIFYGGSFNPWHEGHSACLNLCPSQNIIVIPDNNPWKESSQKHCRWSSFKELALKLKNSPYSIYPGFWADDTPNPTVDWLRKSSYPQKSLLIGDDNFFKLNLWKDYQTLCKHLNTIYVAPRDHSTKDIEAKKRELLKESFCPRIIILNEHPFQPLSSSKLRQKTKF